MQRYKLFFPLLLLLLSLNIGCDSSESSSSIDVTSTEVSPQEALEAVPAKDTLTSFDLDEVPDYSGDPYVVVNGNTPYFEESELSTVSFEAYSELDDLGRCGTTCANVGPDTLPTEERGSISQVKPSGWQTAKYDFIDGDYLYNRCHLIGYQLTAENANEENLITGTRYMNVEGMLPFENMIADYVEETDNQVLYRSTPIFEEDNLVADGVLMEAMSVEDHGEGICFNVYAYNVQPGVSIDYETGESTADGSSRPADSTAPSQNITYILNTNTRKFHLPSCSSVSDIASHNKETFTGTKEELTAQGYEPCGRCKP